MEEIKKKFYRFINIFSLSIIFFNYHCGPSTPDVSSKESPKLRQPKYRNFSESFKLKDDNILDLNLGGSVVFWNKNADVEQLNKVASLSVLTKKIDTDFKDLAEKDFLRWKSSEQLKEKIRSTKKILEEKSRDKVDKFYEDQVEGSYELLERTKSWVENNLKEENKEDFYRYCDSNLLKFASSDILREYKFTKRPTPLAICEGYYEKNNILTPENESLEAKNYFNYFWSSKGVFATSLKVYKRSGSKMIEISQEEKQSLIEKLQTKHWQETLKSKSSLLFAGLIKLNSGEKFYIYFNDKKEKAKDHLTRNIEKYFEKNVNLSSFSLTWTDIKKNIDFTFNDRIHNFYKIDKKATLPEISSFQAKELKNLNHDFPEVYGLELPDFQTLSEAERISTLEKYEYMVELFNKNYQLRMESRNLYNEKKTRWLTYKQKAGEKISKHNLALSVYPDVGLSINIKKDEVKVVMQLDRYLSTQAIVGCYNTSSKTPFICASSKEKSANIFVDIDQGLIKINLNLDELDLIGLSEREKNPNDIRYNMISESEIKNSVLSFELNTQKYQSKLSMVTGKSYIHKDQEELFQGSLTLSKTEPKYHEPQSY
ncbi:MAG: hypothetical protein CMP11_00645 [Zetaproteobacteria bacterium]|nr:hypothetical protein [Pseudobdellovibrionaceae bacterium]